MRRSLAIIFVLALALSVQNLGIINTSLAETQGIDFFTVYTTETTITAQGKADERLQGTKESSVFKN